MPVLVFILGLIIGSFLNVCIYRIPKEESIIFSRSYCPYCKQKIKWRDLIPILSYIFLKGRCRFCKNKISLIYPCVEILNATLYLLLYLKYDFTILFLKYAVLSSLAIVIGFIDYYTTDIYTNTIIFGIATGVIFILLEYFLKVKIITYFLGALMGGGIISVIIFLTNGMGWGDAEFLFVIGLFLGFGLTLITLILSFIIGGIFGIFLVVLKFKSHKDYIPFAPFISIASIIAIFFGDCITKFLWG
ncbi:leader peptidase (prepilin peptidase) / N-methyltransferase [Caloramator fervidus]|uniref:Leader peptidase (Prepilin peptidase) / N-methyltransferase n=1 Tax=Caloramator fervidus TaxID=29344 RepID=A0A1H5V4J2_9CLOT|nr:A24 family peptidase [Caloramator fervidus]SEF81631.1 leader peptidase (prepilin peptidase) / N-methyltransferase [Caloramator fervidus]